MPDYLLPGDWAGDQSKSYENYREYIYELYRTFEPGVTETYIHPAVESDELKAITGNWQRRVWEYKLFSDPEHVSSRAYDLVINGYELLSGSIRIHDQDLQEKVFEAIGLTMESARQRFGFFLDAFRYGTPPHGGVGIGLERLVMVLAGTDNIRDVVAFPTTNSSFDMMSEAPNVVDKAQLDILGIKITKKDSE